MKINWRTKFSKKNIFTKNCILSAGKDLYGKKCFTELKSVEADTEEEWIRKASRINEYYRLNDLETEYPYDEKGNIAS